MLVQVNDETKGTRRSETIKALPSYTCSNTFKCNRLQFQYLLQRWEPSAVRMVRHKDSAETADRKREKEKIWKPNEIIVCWHKAVTGSVSSKSGNDEWR